MPKKSKPSAPGATTARVAYSLKEFCDARSLGYRTGWRLVAEGKIRASRITARRLVVYAEDARAFDEAVRAGRL